MQCVLQADEEKGIWLQIANSQTSKLRTTVWCNPHSLASPFLHFCRSYITIWFFVFNSHFNHPSFYDLSLVSLQHHKTYPQILHKSRSVVSRSSINPSGKPTTINPPRPKIPTPLGLELGSIKQNYLGHCQWMLRMYWVWKTRKTRWIYRNAFHYSISSAPAARPMTVAQLWCGT